MTSDSSSFREGLVWPREANGCVSHTCSVPFTAWTHVRAFPYVRKPAL